MHAIGWPEGFIPGFTDNFASNEMIVAGLSAENIWPLVSYPERWPTYYDNAGKIEFHNNAGPELKVGDRFRFDTFGFPVECEVVEATPPKGDQPGRISWHGWSGDGEDLLDVHHAWIIENLEGGRVRILTQETQNGKPAKELAQETPNPMVNGHQNWLEGLVGAARKDSA
ncbi:SRPBCC domain-containing protein [Fulvimarina sp. MAC3]|uniref:SRPBCC domain-containing protein n=1 Tax=Fulvimarina sp. MAC3 TaxID=3148887 RepID=UPI0031FD41CE